MFTFLLSLMLMFSISAMAVIDTSHEGETKVVTIEKADIVSVDVVAHLLNVNLEATQQNAKEIVANQNFYLNEKPLDYLNSIREPERRVYLNDNYKNLTYYNYSSNDKVAIHGENRNVNKRLNQNSITNRIRQPS